MQRKGSGNGKSNDSPFLSWHEYLSLSIRSRNRVHQLFFSATDVINFLHSYEG